MDWHLKVLKEKNAQPRILYSVKISHKNEGEINNFSDIMKLEELITRRPRLQEMLKQVL